MSTAILDQKKMPDNNLYQNETDPSETLKSEIAELREEIVSLRAEFDQRLARTDKIVSAYKVVLSDMADLIEAEQLENAKREESSRFFMSSAESRIKAEILGELGLDEEDGDAPGQSWWPFKKFG